MPELFPTPIKPGKRTQYLVGPTGQLVWVADGAESFIVAARSAAERSAATRYVQGLLDAKKNVVGLPGNQRSVVAPDGGDVVTGCTWVYWQDAPEPRGDDPQYLPQVYGPAHAAVLEE